METNILPRPEHPQPMFKRENWQNLNGEWAFYNDHGIGPHSEALIKPFNVEIYPQKILVPFCPESELSGIKNKDYMKSVWYKRAITVTEEQIDGRVLLHFGAVDYETDVYVNGEKVGSHFGGYSSFFFDITDYINIGENDITVNAMDNMQNIPSGKQCRDSYNPYGCLYTRTTGIWQTVWLEYVPNGYIKTAKYYPDIKKTAFDMELILSKPGKVAVDAFYEGKLVGNAASEAEGNYLRFTLPLNEKHLWEAGNGRLYDLKFTFETEDGTDEMFSYAGLREIRLDGFRFMLNGKSIFLRTVLDQGYYHDGIYTASTDDDLKRDIEISMQIGFNGARLHEKIFEPRFLYHCDKAGYLVWGEHANWGVSLESGEGFLNFLPEWSETVERDFNHPAIIGWCPLNETWCSTSKTAQRIIEAIYRETKRLDPTRPVIDTSGFCHVITDIYDQHDYQQNTEKFRESYINYNGKRDSFKFDDSQKQKYIPDLPLYVSEYGGLKWVCEDKKDLVPENAWGCGTPETEKEFFDRYEAFAYAMLDAPNIMGFCYTQLYDVEQEVNGLYTYGREKKFDDYSRIIDANTKKANIED